MGAFPVVGFRDRLSVVAEVGPALANVGGVVLFVTAQIGTVPIQVLPGVIDIPLIAVSISPVTVCRIVVIYASLRM